MEDATEDTVERFGKTTRWFHWTFVTSFLALAGTGALLLLRERVGLGAEGVALTISVHKAAAIGLLVLPSLVWLSGDTRATTEEFRELLRWSRADLRWLRLQPRALLGRAALPPAGKLNAGQKLNGLATAGLSAGLVVTGAWLWLRPGSLAAWLVHMALFCSWIPLFVGHLSLALALPGTRPALRGMIQGRVPRRWAEHHHPLWVRGLEEARSAVAKRQRTLPALRAPARDRGASSDAAA